MKEKRRYARVPMRAQIHYKVISEGTAKEFLTKDISLGGIRFFVHEHISKGRYLKIRLTLPGTSFSFEAIVKIEWIEELSSYGGEKCEVGVSFIDIPKEATDHLIKSIKVL
jgi:c-di-GMP-binding flagellar brake protein YcgR